MCTQMRVEFMCKSLLMLVNLYPKIQKYWQMEDVKSVTQHKEDFYLFVCFQLVTPKLVPI